MSSSPGYLVRLTKTGIVLHLKMESIPEPIHGKIVGAGYDSFDKLPNDKVMDRWREVEIDFGLTGPELTQLMNIKFPVPLGNAIIA